MPVPVTIITGFLGAGKTTLVNRILTQEHGKKIAVIINEFGEVGIDDGIVVETKEEIFEMNNGCICCTVRGDLIRILGKLLKRKDNFDAVLIETTGLADPAPVAQTFFVDDDIKEQMSLDAIVTVVDTKHIGAHLDEVKPDGVENESVEQVAFADKILLNKMDLVNEAEKNATIEKIKGINAFAEVIECTNSDVALDKILGVKAFDLERIMEKEPEFLDIDGEHQHDNSVTSVSIQSDGDVDLEAINFWLSTLLKEKGVDIFRSKGILKMAGSDAKYVFQGVHMLFAMASSDEGIGRPWGADEKRTNKLVFIGRNLDQPALEAAFKKCLK
mmetsp:Transcript_20366/g.24450  ORF Transcript_20366/g.24450 Transcript_20366/m.24450 type:complete len:330 (-) Transcript_20366:310-1299(-)|eukprot:CAMPEP_0197850696 /NCGR_PEP_ID=MMETSP1438-20131217/16117_1 /TAXON_ID=1461541 /ORGANISM="Pterosperma sp., Strain CCMP1384" /LENGTH=329 /DNA_ID=CAMNT_0043463993 /DNA_START=63 /DNA_END=1052 /DNA_ORIENTATION=-